MADSRASLITSHRPSAICDGLVIKTQSGFFTVYTDSGPIVCKLRGKLKQERRDSDLAAVGDHVTVTRLPDGTGIIESVAERVRSLARRKPSPQGRAAIGDVGSLPDRRRSEQHPGCDLR